jgi:hypothetical protein
MDEYEYVAHSLQDELASLRLCNLVDEDEVHRNVLEMPVTLISHLCKSPSQRAVGQLGTCDLSTAPLLGGVLAFVLSLYCGNKF